MPPQVTGRKITGVEDLGSRLDCWKEIADYLGRGERTVKRWETERGLPTHRAPGAGRTAVYAYTAELDEWLKTGKAQGLEHSHEEAEEDRSLELPANALDAPDDFAAAGSPASNSPVTQKESKFHWNWALAGMLAAGIAGVGIYVALRPAGYSILHGTPASIEGGQPASNHPGSIPVSDAEKARAHDLYLKGRHEWSQRTPDSLNRALDDFTQAIVHDPGNAQAYAGMADTYDLLEIYATMPEADTYPRALAAARRAVDLDDSLAEAHRALAFAEFYGASDFEDSEKEFRRGIELNPKDPVARRWYANAFATPGRYQESLDQFDKAQELDPASHSTLSDKGIILFNSGRREEGIALLKEVERTDPEFFSPHYYLMLISFELHDFPAFLDEGQKAADIRNDPVLKDTIASARAGYARDDERGLLKDLYAKQEEYYSAGKLAGPLLAKTCVMMGKKQEALQLLETAFARHEMDSLWCLGEPDLLTLKDEPRYKALVQRINFPSVRQKSQPSTPPEEIHPPLRAAS